NGNDKLTYSTTYLTDDPQSLHLLTSHGLIRENGRHVARISNALPVARDMNVDDKGLELNQESAVPLDIPTHPLGVFIGMQPASRERVFLGVERGPEPLWIIGDDRYARLIVLRLSAQRHRIA